MRDTDIPSDFGSNDANPIEIAYILVLLLWYEESARIKEKLLSHRVRGRGARITG